MFPQGIVLAKRTTIARFKNKFPCFQIAFSDIIVIDFCGSTTLLYFGIIVCLNKFIKLRSGGPQ